MKYVLNSAVITGPGDYRYRLTTAEALTEILGVSVPVDRRSITMDVGDESLVFPPGTPRIDPGDKGKLPAAIMAGHYELGLLVRVA